MGPASGIEATAALQHNQAATGARADQRSLRDQPVQPLA
jgi:hypothetical protein